MAIRPDKGGYGTIDLLNNVDRLYRQIRFLQEIDKLKCVLRQSLVSGELRRENSAEHSWHLALAAVVLQEYANEPVDITRVIKMLLIHDVVEIDVGDTFIYDDTAQATRVERERRAAQRIFNLLPPDLAREMLALWEEFEARITPEARFAAALDRLQAILQNHLTDGQTWKRHGISRNQVLIANRHIMNGSKKLWDLALTIINDAVRKGRLLP